MPAGGVTARAGQLMTLLIALAFLGVAIAFVASTSWFTVFLVVHVTFVVIWIGGGAMLTILGLLAERRRDGQELVTIARQAAFVGERIFAPAGIVVVAMGIAMIENAGIGYDHFWVIFGLLGFLSTFVTGVGVLAPMSKRVAAIVEANGPDADVTKAAVSKILLVARADVALLLLVVIDMVARPFS
jgi:uncharacterized membrane protein